MTISRIASIHNQILRFLTWCQIVDPHDSQVSLTNVGTIVVLVKVACVRQAALPDLGALLAMLLARAHKKHIGSKVVANQEELNQSAATALDSSAQAVQMVSSLASRVETIHDRLNIVDNRTKSNNQRLQG